MFIDFSKVLIVRYIEAPQIPPPPHTFTHRYTRPCAHGNIKVDGSGLTVYTV